jgi:hypothetical protein
MIAKPILRQCSFALLLPFQQHRQADSALNRHDRNHGQQCPQAVLKPATFSHSRIIPDRVQPEQGILGGADEPKDWTSIPLAKPITFRVARWPATNPLRKR